MSTAQSFRFRPRKTPAAKHKSRIHESPLARYSSTSTKSRKYPPRISNTRQVAPKPEPGDPFPAKTLKLLAGSFRLSFYGITHSFHTVVSVTVSSCILCTSAVRLFTYSVTSQIKMWNRCQSSSDHHGASPSQWGNRCGHNTTECICFAY